MSNNWNQQHGSLPIGWTPQHRQLELARYALRCDHPGCPAESPLSDAVNFDIGGEKQARAIAEANGWVRVREREKPGDVGTLVDLCPAHAPRRSR